MRKFLKKKLKLVDVTFMVTAPDNTDENICITGSHSNLGSWGMLTVPLKKIRSSYYITVKLPENSICQYKYTRGDWDSVERGKAGEEIPNRVIRVKSGLFVKDSIESWRDRLDLLKRISSRVGNITEHIIDSKILKGKRTFLVYVPPNYYKENEKYPVLYLQDGNNMFDSMTAFLGVEWRMDESLEMLIKNREIEPVIAVAVYNSEYRDDEYTFCRDYSERSGGKADKYLKFIEEELMPFMNKNYRTKTDRENTGLLGSSLGGLLSLYAGYKHNKYFSKLGVVSPSLWWSKEAIMKIIKNRPEEPIKMWIDIGTNEGSGKSILRTRKAVDIFSKTGLKQGKDFKYVEVKNGSHSENDWAIRTPDILRFLYGKNNDQYKLRN